MRDHYTNRAKEILKSIIYATVATASKAGKPWNSPVAYFVDNELNIYWFSAKDSIHSGNIRNSKDIFIVIYDSTMAEGTGEGLYFEATAREITEPNEVKRVADLQTGGMRVSAEQCMGDALHRFYIATPKKAWINDDEKDENGEYVKDIRIEIPLSELV